MQLGDYRLNDEARNFKDRDLALWFLRRRRAVRPLLVDDTMDEDLQDQTCDTHNYDATVPTRETKEASDAHDQVQTVTESLSQSESDQRYEKHTTGEVERGNTDEDDLMICLRNPSHCDKDMVTKGFVSKDTKQNNQVAWYNSLLTKLKSMYTTLFNELHLSLFHANQAYSPLWKGLFFQLIYVCIIVAIKNLLHIHNTC